MSPLPVSFCTIREYQIVKSEMVLEMKFQDKTKSKRCDSVMQKMIVGRQYCYKGKGIYSGTCSV